MGDVIHLNEVRKRRAKSAKQSTAAINRVRHGRTKQATEAARHERDREAAAVDAKLLEDKSRRKRKPEMD